MNPTTKFFILGAADPEMNEIERLLKEAGLPYGYAAYEGRRVQPKTANDAYNVIDAAGAAVRVCPEWDIVTVECAVLGVYPDVRIDHHKPGDPGYGLPPERYMEGSSLGQLLTLMGWVASAQQRIICAADHCLNHAYRGLCPGVDPQELAAWRTQARAAFQKISPEEVERNIQEALRLLKSAESVEVGGEPVAWVGEYNHIELAEASARFGIPMMYRQSEGAAFIKAGIYSAPPGVIRAWMDNCGLNRVYGDPARGYAGGYA